MPKRGGPRYVKARRSAVKKQDGVCFWCGTPMLLKHECQLQHPLRVTADHLIPFAKGGKDGPIAAAHQRCNAAKADCPLDVWLIRVKFRLEKAGNPQYFEVILSKLTELGIPLPVGQPFNGPDGHQSADCPAPDGQDPPPKG